MDRIWAPWRMEYIGGLGENEGTCFLCRAAEAPAEEERSLLVLARGPSCVCVMNRFPYTGGHLMVAPRAHKASLEDLGDGELLEMMRMTNRMTAGLRAAFRPHGFNVGFNIGRPAGAGLPGHVHLHVVPRWEGDTNFMPVLADVRVMPEALAGSYDRLREALEKGGA